MVKLVGVTVCYRGVIGILGGSFDPPHEGHLYSAELARKFLGLSQVWWLVAWQHALKSRIHQANFLERANNTQKFIRYLPHHRVCKREGSARITHSIDTIRLLKKNYRQATFIWILGTDSFIALAEWHQWQKFVQEIPLIVIARDHHSRKSVITSKVGLFLRRNFRHHFSFDAGCWWLCNARTMSISSSNIRQMKGTVSCA